MPNLQKPGEVCCHLINENKKEISTRKNVRLSKYIVILMCAIKQDVGKQKMFVINVINLIKEAQTA